MRFILEPQTLNLIWILA